VANAQRDKSGRSARPNRVSAKKRRGDVAGEEAGKLRCPRHERALRFCSLAHRRTSTSAGRHCSVSPSHQLVRDCSTASHPDGEISRSVRPNLLSARIRIRRWLSRWLRIRSWRRASIDTRSIPACARRSRTAFGSGRGDAEGIAGLRPATFCETEGRIELRSADELRPALFEQPTPSVPADHERPTPARDANQPRGATEISRPPHGKEPRDPLEARGRDTDQATNTG
jgi:hypothetical protein